MGCSKADITPISSQNNISVNKADSLKSIIYNPGADTLNTDYWYNGTTGTALIQVVCKDCSALASIGDDTIPFIFNANGVGLLKYTPMPGLSIRIAVCPGGVKSIQADIFDAANTSFYTYSGTGSENWSDTYIIN